MSQKDDGGPAFPVAWPLPNAPEPGMNLRDYFAAKAMQEVRWIQGDQKQNSACAAMTYEIADAMLKARES